MRELLRRLLLPARFALVRDDDVTGVSGTGRVASGVRLPLLLGAVLRWRGPTWSVVWYPRMAWVSRVHGHDGATEVVWTKPSAGPVEDR